MLRVGDRLRTPIDGEWIITVMPRTWTAGGRVTLTRQNGEESHITCKKLSQGLVNGYYHHEPHSEDLT